MNRIWILAAIVGLASCGVGEPDVAMAEQAWPVSTEPSGSAPPQICRVAEADQSLPDDVRESSGLAQSRRDPDLFWTHNDAGNEPDLFALNTAGEVVQRVRVAGAELTDWEDLASGPCGAGSCLYVGDIGDNDAERERITIYRIPEPERGARESAPAEALHARFPEGARDAESLFVLPSGALYVVTKGRHGPVALFRFPVTQRPGEVATLEHVRELFPEPEGRDDRVTGAGASPEGRWVGIRSYRRLYLYPAAELIGGGAVKPTTVDLEPLRQKQGEAMVIAGDGSVWVTSEAAGKNESARWARLQCTFPGT